MNTIEHLSGMLSACEDYYIRVRDIGKDAGARWVREVAQPSQITAVINLGTLTPSEDEFAEALGLKDELELALLFDEDGVIHNALPSFIRGVWDEANFQAGRRWGLGARPNEIAAVLAWIHSSLEAMPEYVRAIIERAAATPLGRGAASFIEGVRDVEPL